MLLWSFTAAENSEKNQKLGYYWVGANQTWRPVNCFQNVLYGEKLDDSDVDVFGGCDWVECITYCILIASSLVTLSLILMLLYFQIGLHGFNTVCLRKTKTYALLLSLAFNICLIIDLLRYP